MVTDRRIAEFQRVVLDYYEHNGRHKLPWRQVGADGTIDPYHVLVSELMLQQTQVPRVTPKFKDFIVRFPSFAALANAPLAEVLKAWSGLGYNRRAKFLWEAATIIMHKYNGNLPHTTTELIGLPGVGPNTAGALLAYAYNKPVVFVETNIRTVFISHFFADQAGIDDKHIADVVARTLPNDVRSWYWALMDYGTHIKQSVGNLNMLSKHYKKQTAFHGSRRQVRGRVLRVLAAGPQSLIELKQLLPDERLEAVLAALVTEGLISQAGNHYTLYGA